MNFNIQQVAVLQVGNQTEPVEGPRAIPFNLDFTTSTGQPSYDIDLSVIQSNQPKISMIQTAFVDLSGTDSPLQIKVQGTNQTIVAKGRTQGFYSLLAPTPSRFNIACASDSIVPVALLNVPVAGVVWPTQ
jgi:hypothetical protein